MQIPSTKHFTERPSANRQRKASLAGGLLGIFVAILVLAVTGCRSADQRAADAYYINGVGESPMLQSAARQGQADYSTNLLHEGDVVDINFQYSTNFSTVQKINLDGALNLSTVGKVQAAGLTVLQLQDEVIRLYKPQVKDDVVTVKLVSSSDMVFVGGAVVRAGPVELSRPLTVLEAIMTAGGFDGNRAKLSTVKVLRIEQGRQHVYVINLNRVLSGREMSPFYLKPFDVVYVPVKTFNY